MSPGCTRGVSGTAGITFAPDAGRRSWVAPLRWLGTFARRKPLGFVGLLVLLPSSSASFNASASNVDNSYVTDTLDPPTNVAGTSGTSATVGWTQTVDSYADGYRVLRSSTSGGPYTQVAQVTPVSANSYVDAAAEGRYYYVTRAFAEGWESANSGETTTVVLGSTRAGS